MIVHQYLWRGVIVECPCGQDHHVKEEQLAGFTCPCGQGRPLGSAAAYRALESLMAAPEQAAARGLASLRRQRIAAGGVR